MPQNDWTAYVADRLARVRECIQETERLMRPPTAEELLCLQSTLQGLQEQDMQLTHPLAQLQPPEVSDL